MKNFRTNLISFLLLIFIVFSFLESCKKSDFGSNGLVVEGKITGPNGLPLENVTVITGSVTVTTDGNGSFRATNCSFPNDDIIVIAQLDGFFKGSRTVRKREGSNHYVHIQLLNREIVSQFESYTAGLAISGEATINFQSNSYIKEDGSIYDGTVYVYSAYLNPLDENLLNQMPGDLKGIRTSGELNGLITFGMVNVELEGDGGIKLKLKPGNPAEIKMKIPTALIASAPPSIPLWHFNDSLGLWKEEGISYKIGDTYIGTVTHFSFWNMDLPYTGSKISMKFVNLQGRGIPNLFVRLINLSDSSQAGDITDNNGYVDGYVNKNSSYRREITYQCGSNFNLLYSDIIGPFPFDTDLSEITLNYISPEYINLTGTASTCNNQPIITGYVVIQSGSNSVKEPIINGTYNVNYPTCGGVSSTLSATVINFSEPHWTQSSAITIPSYSQNIPLIQTCEPVNDFINFTVNGQNFPFPSTNRFYFRAFQEYYPQNGFYDVGIQIDDTTGGLNTSLINLKRPQNDNVAPVSMEVEDILLSYPPIMQETFYRPISYTQTPVFTEYGPLHLFISGGFSGRFVRLLQGIQDTVNMTLSFRCLRVP